ncbi:unnamed protein product [Adineta steineri]|uniref:PARG catalytic Macro domain-containing protein n=1 Tax=Adineta steineri TaxID=433720 RepID=A0A813TRZ1_9BILA|nr:unnamed protein product [Adineta steineri]CAF3589056.1 unnamed protein product [Adineta steineri]
MAVYYKLGIKSFSESKDRIIRNNQNNNQYIDTIENANFINGYDLFTYSPARYQDQNKKALLDDVIQNKKYIPSKQDILIARFYPKPLPNYYTYEQHCDMSKTYAFIPNTFDYIPSDEVNVIDWHMNFANYDIFSYYHGSLLAQDELQVLECPQLACLREYLLQQSNQNNGDKPFSTRVMENNLPYPILISNTERAIDLNTANLYGNSFSSSSKSTVLKSYKYLNPSQIINIIAIEAPKYGQGSYTIQQIEYILQACLTAYSAAKTLANTTYILNKQKSAKMPLKTYIHTGWFGCGAYGGNRAIMIVLQILAAKMAGIEKIIFHTVTDNCQQEIQNAETCLKNLFDNDHKPLSINELITKIVNEHFQWGFSNGT